MSNVFDPKKLDKLNNPMRLKDIPPQFIWEKMALENPSVCVDIGAGTGFFSIPFSEYLSNGTLYACDISDVMLSWMNENVVDKHPVIKTLKIENNRLPLDDSIADFVFMIALHHELDDHSKTLSESYRVLKDGAKIAIVDWKKVDMPYGPPLKIRYNPEDVEAQLKEAGFIKPQSFMDLEKFFVVIAEK